MTGLFKAPKVSTPKQAQIDDTAALRDQRDRALRRGRAATILTSDKGLPDLGATRNPTAGGY